MYASIYENLIGKININREKIFNIKNYIDDGFEKVCNVSPLKNKEWMYSKINKELMFSEHRSWVYFVVIDNSIVKCGETGNPLGIPSKTRFLNEMQPVTGTKSRFGRLRADGNTDEYLREAVIPYVLNGHTVSLWAKKCPITNKQVLIAGETKVVPTTMHKDLEKMYLEYFKTQAYCLPLFNKATK